MTNLDKAPKRCKTSEFKAIFKDFITSDYFFVFILLIVFIGGIILAFVLPPHIAPAYTVQANVTAVGYKGVTVEYLGEYGKAEKRTVDVDDVSEFQEGDTVTIEIKAWQVKVVGIDGGT